MRSKLRDGLDGASFDQDRLWQITGPNFCAGLTEYNDELTGFAPILRGVFGKDNVYHAYPVDTHGH